MNSQDPPNLRQFATLIVCGLLPALLLVGVVITLTSPTPAGWYHALDFHTPWQAARAFASHHDPYARPGAFVPSGPHQSFVYPAPTAALLVPFGFLPYGVAAAVFVTLLTAAVAGALWLLGVRDWRCYGAVFASPAVLTAVSVGTLTPLLLLGVAATWRWRKRPLVAGVAVALTALLKVFLWPLLVWLWFTGRRRAAMTAVAIDASVSLAAWAWISFAGLGDYPHLLQRLGAAEGRLSYAPLWLVGANSSVYIAASVAAAIVAAYAARRFDEAPSLAVTVLAALLAAPVLWLHYLALVAAVAALYRPRLQLLWLLPLLLWLTPQQQSGGTTWRIAIVVGLIVVAAGATVGKTRTSGWLRRSLLPAPGR